MPDLTPEQTARRDRLAEALLKHPYRPTLARGIQRCGCGESALGDPGWHRAHLAAALLPLWEQEIAEAEQRGRVEQLTPQERRDVFVVYGYKLGLQEGRAEVLREAAEDWIYHDGRAVLFNKAGHDLTPEGRVGKWLRDRATLAAHGGDA